MKPGLTNNQLKLIALITMTIDHIGVAVLPQYPLLRIIGRLSFPVFAYMIAEGCVHTRDIWRYFRSIAALAVLCQAVQYLVTGSLYMGILVTFSLSILVVMLLQKRWWIAALAALAGTFILCTVRLPGTDFRVDYGFVGVLVPVAVYLAKTKWGKCLACSGMLVLLAASYGGSQWYALLSIPLLLAYNGERGRLELKGLFYWYYPAHIAAIYGLSFILR